MNLALRRHPADSMAVDAMTGCRPRWTAIATARDVLGVAGRFLLHAGPPVPDRSRLALPLRNSLLMAILFEGWATDRQGAEDLLMSEAVRLYPAQDHGCAIPLADVLSPSMQVLVIEDGDCPSRRSFSTLNGGDGPVMRIGQYGENVLQRLRWINQHLAPRLQTVIARQPMDVLPVADAALAAGDDCHGRTQQGSQLVAKALLEQASPGDFDDDIRRFLEQSAAFFLNLWMAAVKCCLLAAEDVPGSSVVTAAGGNGEQFGIQVSAMPGRWFAVAAQAPRVPGADEQTRQRALGAIGDSAIVDAFGSGAMARDLAPLTAERLDRVCAEHGQTFPAQLLQHRHPQLLASQAFRTGLDARQACRLGAGPVISLGVLDRQGLLGRLDGGFFFSPLQPLQAALDALEAADAPA
ncbi:hypothetical protein H681_14470 [Pseudomonas sp. ATCC 13867]|uniref:DUF1116 domain-containing protein n=1 Tax=Pseudomonas sp. ATCC 13867 TaxID=1294143 RepID=UPI0002C4E68B|nr:DUF1116 domain-containing protein [Pseudomonas sp. ATCC 13867]AGI24764.1 hypothetical protein H681_14470 [Pseudomonas sp. ATCC 13867]RFQ27521.1 DUF1116 domain-containing protein [Pseudomonas sp. ATCC 13867]